MILLASFGQEDDHPHYEETINKEDIRDSFGSETAHKGSFSSVASEKSPKVADKFEPIDIDGQQQTGIWVHHPGSDVSQTWEPRKGKGRRLDTQICKEADDVVGSINSAASGPYPNESSSTDENAEGSKRNSVRRGLKKLGSVFHRNPRTENHSGNLGGPIPSPHANLKAVNKKEIGVNFIMDDNICGDPQLKVSKGSSPEASGPDSPSKGSAKGVAKSILKHAGKSARSIKSALSRKGSGKFPIDSGALIDREQLVGRSDSSDEESMPSSVDSPAGEMIPLVPDPAGHSSTIDPFNSNGHTFQTIEPSITSINSTNNEKTKYLEGN